MIKGKGGIPRGKPLSPLAKARLFVARQNARKTLADGEALKAGALLNSLEAYKVPEDNKALAEKRRWTLLSLRGILKSHGVAAEEWLEFREWAKRHNSGELPKGEKLRELRKGYIALQEMQNRP